MLKLLFALHASLSAILSAQAAIECHLRYEYFAHISGAKKWGLFQLLNELQEITGVEEDLINDLDKLRRFRNRWVHVKDPLDDNSLLEKPSFHEKEIEDMALLAIKSMLRVVYLEQWI